MKFNTYSNWEFWKVRRFLIFKKDNGFKVKRFQFTALDDATRIRILKIHEKHTQQSSIHFIDDVMDKFPFRIQAVRTDHGHELQSKFHWHVEDPGMRHAGIKPGTPGLKVKSNDLIKPINKSSTNFWNIQRTREKSLKHGKISTILIDLTAPWQENPLTKP